MPKASDFLVYLNDELNAPSIYVLGAQGESVIDILPKIMSLDGSRVGDILKHLSDVLKKGADINKMRAYDCSGLGVKYFLANKLIKNDMTADDIYKLCSKIDSKDLRIGDCVFQEGTKTVNGKKVLYKHHIGYYIGNGYVIEAKGRLYGVVKTKYSEGNWTHCGRLNWWDPEKMVLTRKLKYVEKNYMRGDDVKAVQNKLNSLGYSCGTADGIYGEKTMNAVVDFQGNQRVPKPIKYGVVGKTTAEALGFEWEVEE